MTSARLASRFCPESGLFECRIRLPSMQTVSSRLVRMPHPPAEHANRIVATIIADVGRLRGWPEDALPELEPEVRSALIAAVQRGMSPRRLNTVLEEILAIETRRRLVS